MALVKSNILAWLDEVTVDAAKKTDENWPSTLRKHEKRELLGYCIQILGVILQILATLFCP